MQSIKGPKVDLQPKAAETLGLAVHELATNAVKYGALSAERGRITVAWAIDATEAAPRLVFSWIETGITFSGEPPTRHGFGTQLIERTLAYELDGQASLRFEPTGLQCTLWLPLDGRLVVVDAH